MMLPLLVVGALCSCATRHTPNLQLLFALHVDLESLAIQADSPKSRTPPGQMSDGRYLPDDVLSLYLAGSADRLGSDME